jgi:CO dehydrogenase maturation factor
MDFAWLSPAKGGVGKTTLTACLSRMLAGDGLKVLAADEDPQMNLPYALGLPVAEAEQIVPLNRNPDYIEEKTGARPGKSFGALFRLNPVSRMWSDVSV